MNWNRSSRAVPAVLALALLVLSLVAGPAAAVSVSSEGVPSSAEAGAKTSATYTFTELYDQYDTWTLQGRTELRQVTWTVTLYDQTGSRIARETYNGQTFSQRIAASEDVSRVTVEITGRAPEVSEFSYQPPQRALLAQFSQTQQGGTSTLLSTDRIRPYTEQSQRARAAIGRAEGAVADASAAGADTDEAERLLSNAVSAFENGNFGNAVDLAEQAEAAAGAAAESRRTLTYAVYGAVALVGLLALAGGAYWYRNNRKTRDPLA
jgi:hypothetical protein